MSADGWASFGRDLLKGPRWLWTGVLVLTSIRLFFFDSAIGRTFHVDTWGESWWIDVGASFLFISSASFLIFDLGQLCKPFIVSWNSRRRVRRKNKKMADLLGQLSDDERAILAEAVFTGHDRIEIRNEQAHMAAIQLQQHGIGIMMPGMLFPEFLVETRWMDFGRLHAIAPSGPEGPPAPNHSARI